MWPDAGSPASGERGACFRDSEFEALLSPERPATPSLPHARRKRYADSSDARGHASSPCRSAPASWAGQPAGCIPSLSGLTGRTSSWLMAISRRGIWRTASARPHRSAASASPAWSSTAPPAAPGTRGSAPPESPGATPPEPANTNASAPAASQLRPEAAKRASVCDTDRRERTAMDRDRPGAAPLLEMIRKDLLHLSHRQPSPCHPISPGTIAKPEG